MSNRNKRYFTKWEIDQSSKLKYCTGWHYFADSGFSRFFNKVDNLNISWMYNFLIYWLVRSSSWRGGNEVKVVNSGYLSLY